MAITLAAAGSNLSTTRVVARPGCPKHGSLNLLPRLNCPWRTDYRARALHARTLATPPSQSISEKISESIKQAEEVCAGDAASGECAAAWDEVEEVSAAASDVRLKQKAVDSDPLETFCKDNMETDECRTYED